MGGTGNDGQLGDVILFNTETEEAITTVQNFAGLLSFSASG